MERQLSARGFPPRRLALLLGAVGLVVLGVVLVVVLASGGDDDEPVRFRPAANAVPFGGPTPLKVQFTASAGNIPGEVSYHWCFNDGTVSNEQNPVHVFKRAGYYLVEVDIEGKNVKHRANRSLYLGAWPPKLWERSRKGFSVKTIKNNIKVQQARTKRRQAELKRRERETGVASAESRQPCGELRSYGPNVNPSQRQSVPVPGDEPLPGTTGPGQQKPDAGD
jgi:hypothetical protein